MLALHQLHLCLLSSRSGSPRELASLRHTVIDLYRKHQVGYPAVQTHVWRTHARIGTRMRRTFYLHFRPVGAFAFRALSTSLVDVRLHALGRATCRPLRFVLPQESVDQGSASTGLHATLTSDCSSFREASMSALRNFPRFDTLLTLGLYVRFDYVCPAHQPPQVHLRTILRCIGM